jgi:hypothetical protein
MAHHKRHTPLHPFLTKFEGRDVILIAVTSHWALSIARVSDRRQYFLKLMSRIIWVWKRLCRAIGQYGLVSCGLHGNYL